MRFNRRLLGALAGGLIVLLLVVAIEPSMGYSDGIAGSSGAIPEHLKKCRGAEYCKVHMPGCGGCHGDREAMLAQRGSEPPVIDRIQLVIKFNGNEDFQEYDPGTTYVVDLEIVTDRPFGQYNSGGFNLNVSAGRLSKITASDDTVRIAGGQYQHAGSKNASTTFQGDKYGDDLSDESAWAGEATNTGKGAERRSWRLKWAAPERRDPHGVAFQVAFIVPDGNGWDNSCVNPVNSSGECDPSLGYSDQNTWDWWYFGAPLRIYCERGEDRQTCRENVLSAIRPPPPPLDTCPQSATTCVPATETNGDGGGNGAPVPIGFALVAVAVAALWIRRRP